MASSTLKGKKLTAIQKKTLLSKGYTSEQLGDILYQRDVTIQDGGSKSLRSDVDKVTYWQFVDRATGKIFKIPVVR